MPQKIHGPKINPQQEPTDPKLASHIEFPSLKTYQALNDITQQIKTIEKKNSHKIIWEKAITKKRITILMKETKIKTSSLSLTLKPGNKILVRLIIFLLSEKPRTQNIR